MPNRILKESICTSESLIGLDPRAEVFFYRLIVNCDDYGRMDGRTAILRSKCFPLMMEAVTIRDIEGWLAELVRAGLVHCYQWADRPYLMLVTWGKHQKIRAKRSKYPGPGGDQTSENDPDVCEHMQTDADRLSRYPNPNPNPKSNLHPDLKRNPKKRRAAAKPAGENGVALSPEERKKLMERYGQAPAERMIATLAAYKQRTGRIYRSDYRAILNWVAKKVLDEAAEPAKKGVSQRDAHPESSAKSFGFDRESFLWQGGDAGRGSVS